MIWQDIVIAVVSIVLTVALIPQAYKGFKRKKGLITRATSIPTAIGLYINAGVFFTLELYFTTVVILFGAILWTILLFQRVIYEND